MHSISQITYCRSHSNFLTCTSIAYMETSLGMSLTLRQDKILVGCNRMKQFVQLFHGRNREASFAARIGVFGAGAEAFCDLRQRQSTQFLLPL